MRSLLVFTILVAGLCLATACTPSPYTTEGLAAWEARLLRECPISALGRVEFNTSATTAIAQSRFIIGLKTLHNFQYDLCKHMFSATIEDDPSLVIAYSMRALCEAQLVWNAENRHASQSYLDLARANNNPFPPTHTTQREMLYFTATEALVNGSLSGTHATRRQRYQAYLSHILEIESQFPSDSTAASWSLLVRIALNSASCSTFSPACVEEQRSIREIAEQLYSRFPEFPGVLHYGMHAYDFPNSTLFEPAKKYAVDYPKFVNETCHSIHMASHIHQRAGRYAQAEHADRMSVQGADTFQASGALAMDGGPITPANGFEFDAGNLYHSLEYQHHSLLMQCNFRGARRLVSRMSRASWQVLGSGGVLNREGELADFGKRYGDASVNATTYHQWYHRMWARQVLLSWSYDLFGATHRRATDWLGALTAPTLPPLSWNRATVYNHDFFSPQSEAGSQAAIAIALLEEYKEESDLAVDVSNPNDNLHTCGAKYSSLETDDGMSHDVSTGCVPETVAAAKEMIRLASQHYRNLGIDYEAKEIGALLLQVEAMEAMTQGNVTLAEELADQAMATADQAVTNIVPASTSLMFLPAHLVAGHLFLRAATADRREEMLDKAEAAFLRCLETQRPNHTSCVMGLAQVAVEKQDRDAQSRYFHLLRELIPRGSDCEDFIAAGWIENSKAENHTKSIAIILFVVGFGGVLLTLIVARLRLRFKKPNLSQVMTSRTSKVDYSPSP